MAYSKPSPCISVLQFSPSYLWAGLSFSLNPSGSAPKCLFVDNGSEFAGQLLDLWAYHHQTKIDFSRPGKPTDNCFIETFNGSLRDECLNVHWFTSLEEAKVVVEAWRVDYNETRPHTSLRDMTPADFARAAPFGGQEKAN